MPIVSVRDWDPTGKMTATPEQKPAGQDAMQILAGLIGIAKARKKSKVDQAFRTSAAQALAGGNAEQSFDYDSSTGQFTSKIAPKKNDVGDAVNRFKTMQQFGVDPVTGQPVPEEKLHKPRFGYTGDLLAQLLGNPQAMGEVLNDTPTAAPAAALPADAGIDTGSFTGGQPNFLDPLELEAQNAMAKGAPVDKVKARLAQLRKGKSGGV